MISSGSPVHDYIVTSMRHLLMRQGTLGLKMKIMSQCASIHGGYGCDQNRNRKILGSERKAIVMAANECPECKEGHFDFCMDENWGGTVLGRHGGIDNPALMYREVPCPKVLTDRLKR